MRRAGGDARAFAGRIARIQHVDGNIFLDGGQHRRRMQNFRAEVREFGGFVEADDFDAAGFGTDSGIGGEDAVDVGPDFDAVGAQACADDGGGKIGAAAADGGRDAGAIRADESAHHRDLACREQWLNFLLQPGVGFLVLRNGLHVAVVGDQYFAGVDVDSVESAGGEGGGDDFAGKHFAESGDMVGGAGRDFADGGDAAQKFVERFEVGAQFGVEFGEAGGAEQFAGGIVVALLQRAAKFERGLALACPGGSGHGQQRVGDLGHGADDNDGLLRQAAFDDGGDAVDGFGIFDGSAAELHDDHGRSSWRKLERIWVLSPARARRVRDSRRESGATLEVTPSIFGVSSTAATCAFIPGSPWLSAVRH